MARSVMMEVRSFIGKTAWFFPGFLLFASFPPMCEHVDILFALAPLMVLSRGGNAGKAALRWFQSGVFFWVATLSWMPAIVKNSGPLPLVIAGWSILSLYCSAYFALYGWLSAKYWRWAKGMRPCGGEDAGECRFKAARRLLGLLVVEPVLWCGLELVRSRLLGGFSWNLLGVVPANSAFGAPAALGGVYLLSAIVILVNGSIAGIAERFIASVRAKMHLDYDKSATGRYLSLETIASFALVFAVYRAAEATYPERDLSPVKVAMIQRDFPCCFRAQEERPVEVYSNLLSRVSAFAPDIVVLPESAMAEFGEVDSKRARAFASYAMKISRAGALLAGGSRTDGEGRLYNSAALYSSRATQVYDKVHLVPFGEFIPFDKVFPVLQKLSPVGSCTPGKAETLSLPLSSGETVPFGTAICFEDTDSALVRKFAAAGARILFFITNDSWFSRSNEALAHSWQATARAWETALPVARTGNSGVTQSISYRGERNFLTDSDARPLVDAPGVMCDTLAAPRVSEGSGGGALETTLYVKTGDWPLGIVFALLITLMIMVKYRV